MNVVTDFLTTIGMWPKPHLTNERVAHVNHVLKTARDEADQLADELETLAGREDDPFGTFARRARESRLHGQK